jgi:aminopeptidase N
MKKETSSALPFDPHSFANFPEVKVDHQHFDLQIDFSKKIVKGKTILSVSNPDGAKELRLDCKNLVIEKVWSLSENRDLPFLSGNPNPILGQALTISLPQGREAKIGIQYQTTQDSDALQWLEPSQTAGKKQPFLFTQGQAILSRTWFPCQDGPGMRFTWSADVKVSPGLEAIMSAEIRKADSATGFFHFEMNQAVPAYLVALAVGNLAFASIDERTGIFAEPVSLPAAVSEFSEMGKMVQAAENLYGKYRWGRYDVLVLPPSFPFGGMENPCVTFATPTILAGDKSLTSLIAHELAHSWSGNLVTNANWNDFWLNEGFTVYFERRIMEVLEGKSYSDMLAVLGYGDLQSTLADFGPNNPATCLKLKLEGLVPDEGMTDIAYEKGYLFLCQIEQKVGRLKWDAFLRQYFSDHAFQSMTTEKFVEYLEEKLLKPNGLQTKDIQMEAWIYQPNLPAARINPHSERLKNCESAASAFQMEGMLPGKTEKWSSHEWLHFLRSFSPSLEKEKMAQLDGTFHFTQTGNSEVLFEWLMLSVENGYDPAFQRLESFLESTGRRKFVLPLYKALNASKTYAASAKLWFDRFKENYHPVTRNSVSALFNK